MSSLSTNVNVPPIEEQESLQDEENSESSLRIHEALKIEYRDMARWYDHFWGDYLNKTLELPMKLIRETKQKLQKGRNELKIVDVGCGTGEFLKRLASCESNRGGARTTERACEFCGVDPSREMLEQARKKFLEDRETKIELLPGQAESLPLAESSTDIVSSTSALHFFGDKKRALEEMHRVLKPQGILIITDWCGDSWLVQMYHFLEYVRWNVFHQYSQRYPGPVRSNRLLELVSNAGFHNVRVRTYYVRVFGIFYWGMQTVTASKR
jgi:ubiquinone/menaquinone biosynthesis C-methylase UbiE